MMDVDITYDCATGQTIERPLSAEELAVRAARRLAADQERQQTAQEETQRQADLSPLRRARIQAALDEIDAENAVLDGTPTVAQVVQILRRSNTRQKAIIRALARLVDKE